MRAGLLSLLSLLAACGGGGGSERLTLPRLEWTWVEVPGAVCGDGSQTGIAVNPGPEGSTDVLVFLDGGGACWDGFTCNTLGTASPGPFGAAEFQGALDAGRAEGTILDRTVESSPFGAATLVFVPYCTGDVHWGDSDADYGWQHEGKTNLERDVDWLAEHLPAPERLVVSGSSAGGFGTLLAHDLARTRWPEAKGYLIDDSGPPLIEGDVPIALRAAWYVAWRLDRTLTPFCAECTDDLSQAIVALTEKYPDDRFALVSTRQDAVIRSFFGLGVSPVPAETFEGDLLELVDQRIAPLANARAFLVPGDGHALLEDFDGWEADGTRLPEWIGHMVNDDPGWSTLGRGEQELTAAPLR